MRVLMGIGAALIFLPGWAAAAPQGLIVLKSNNSVEQTEQRLLKAIEDKGAKHFVTLNHQKNADTAGLNLRPTRVVIFGSPKLGTPFMQCARTVAIDLPQKMLIWQDEQGVVWLAYNDPGHIAQRHGVERCGDVVEKMTQALANFANHAAAPNQRKERPKDR